MASPKQFIQEVISTHKVAVFSKTYCPYCVKAKRALDSVGAKPFIVELDERTDLDGDAIQTELGYVKAYMFPAAGA